MSVQDAEMEGIQPLSEGGPVDTPPSAPEDGRLDPEAEQPPERPVEDAEDLLEPKLAPVERIIGPDPNDKSAVYIQRELTWFGKIQLYGLLGRAVKVVMEGEGGLGINDLFSLSKPRDMMDQIMAGLPGADTAPDAEEDKDSVDATQMLAAFARVISISPDLFKELYCVILAAPKGHWKWLNDWGLDTMSDEQGTDILETFIDQNVSAIEGFFTQDLPRIAKRAVQAQRRSSGAR